MKKILVLCLFLCLTACNENKNIENEDNSKYLYCYKTQDNYEEYIDINYNKNEILSLNYSYIVNNISSKQEKELKSFFEKYSNIVEYSIDNNELIILFDFSKITKNDYINIKDFLINMFNFKSDNYNYYSNKNIEYSIFVNDFLKDYSCE